MAAWSYAFRRSITLQDMRNPRPIATGVDRFLEVAKYSGVLLLAFILFFESGNEACIAGWTSTYVDATGYSPRIATLVLVAYWAALMLSRMLAAGVLRRVGKSHLVVATALLSLGGCAILLAARSLGLLVAGTALIGLSYGPIFPTTLAIAGDRYSQRAGTVFGLLFSIALIGGMMFPWAFGQVSQRVSVRAGMIVPGLGAVCIIGLSLAIMSRERHSAVMPRPGDARSQGCQILVRVRSRFVRRKDLTCPMLLRSI